MNFFQMSYWDLLTVLEILDSPPPPSNYWDWLPPEIQEHILTFRDSQALIERRESRLNRKLCEEIGQYGELREKWGLGHIRVSPICKKTWMDDGAVIKFHFLHIFGEFRNSRGEKQKQFLGFGFRKALSLCDLVKGELPSRNRRFGNVEVRVVNARF